MKQHSRFEQAVINLAWLIVVIMLMGTIGAAWWRFIMRPLLGGG